MITLDSDVYRDELRSLSYGLPLYEPCPSCYDHVRVGDVGLLSRQGFFDRVFNIFYDANHSINSRFGVPEGFKKEDQKELKVLKGRAGWFKSEHVEIVDTTEGSDVLGLSSLKVRSPDRNGAILYLPNGGELTTAEHPSSNWWREYIRAHFRSWRDHMKANALIGTQEPAIVFVSGHYLTDKWAMGVIRNTNIESRTVLSNRIIRRPAADESEPPETQEFSVPLRCFPRHEKSSESGRESSQSIVPSKMELDQCVFISGYQISEQRFGFGSGMRIRLPKVSSL